MLASSIPFVAIWVCVNPSSLAILMSSTISLRTVGSPPENCIAGVATGWFFLKFLSIPLISSWVGSYNVPEAAALAKHIGQVRLHLFVTSIKPSIVWLLCWLHNPQLDGHSPFSASLRFFNLCGSGS